MNKINSRILIAVVVYILLTIVSFSVGWWIIGFALIAGGGFILYRISGPSVGITQLDFLKKIPGNKSWWTYGLVTFSTLYFVLLGFGVLKWGWVQFNVIIMLVIIASSSILARSKDISSSLQGVMKLWTVLSIVGIVILIIATRFSPELVQNLDYSHSSTPPTEQSAGQQEQVAPAPVEEIPSTERVVVAGRKITLTGDGTYSVPAGKKSLCFENLGMKDGSSKTSQYLTINGIEYSSLGTECHNLDENLSGEIIVDFFPGKDYGSKEGAKQLYNYWRSQPGGQSEWPVIRIGE